MEYLTPFFAVVGFAGMLVWAYQRLIALRRDTHEMFAELRRELWEERYRCYSIEEGSDKDLQDIANSRAALAEYRPVFWSRGYDCPGTVPHVSG